jgi:hypothetical protein
MIQTHQDVLIVRYGDGTAEPLTIRELIERLDIRTEGELSGLQPWVLEQVITAIFRHFQQDLKQNSVSHSELIKLIQGLQQSFLVEVIQQGQMRFQMDLFELAKRNGAAFELEFYAEVKQFILGKALGEDASRSQENALAKKQSGKEQSSPNLRITGLRRCAKFLAGRSRWSKRCCEVRNEIMNFIRTETEKTGIQNLSLIVLS